MEMMLFEIIFLILQEPFISMLYFSSTFTFFESFKILDSIEIIDRFLDRSKILNIFNTFDSLVITDSFFAFSGAYNFISQITILMKIQKINKLGSNIFYIKLFIFNKTYIKNKKKIIIT